MLEDIKTGMKDKGLEAKKKDNYSQERGISKLHPQQSTSSFYKRQKCLSFSIHGPTEMVVT